MAPLSKTLPLTETQSSTTSDDENNSSKKPSRKPELTRLTTFKSYNAASQARSATPTITWIGPSYTICGYDLEEIENTEEWWLGHIHPEDVEDLTSSYRQHLQPCPARPYHSEARLWSADYRFRRKDGTYLLVSERGTTIRDKNGFVTKLTSVIIDKTLQNRQRSAHRWKLEQRNYLATVAENTPSGIYLMDNQGYVIYMNKAAELITGYTFEELSPYTFHASCHSCRPSGDIYPIGECPILLHQQANVSVQNHPEVFVHKVGLRSSHISVLWLTFQDGHFYDVVFSISPIGDNYASGAMIEFRDVSEQRRMERERLDAILDNQQKSIVLKESQTHKEALANFVAFLAHESRNPLQGITASAEFLLDSMKELELLTERLSTLNRLSTAQQDGKTAKLWNLKLDDNSPVNGESQHLTQTISDIAVNLKKGLRNAQEYITNIQVINFRQV